MVKTNEQFLTGQSFQLAPTDYETDESEGVDNSLPIGEQIQTLITQKQDPQNMSRAERRRYEYNLKRQEREKDLHQKSQYRNRGKPKPDYVYEQILSENKNPRGVSVKDRSVYNEAREWWKENKVPDLEKQKRLGLLGLMSVEAEVVGALAAEADYDVGGMLRGNPVSLIVNGYKFGQDFIGFGRSSERARELTKGLNPFDRGDESVFDSLMELKELHEERPMTEQIAMGFTVPSSVIPIGIGGSAAKSGAKAATSVVTVAPHLKATSNVNVFKTIVGSVPDVIADTPSLAEAFKSGSDELITTIMNKPINIEGIPDNTLFEGDIRLWLDMGDDPISLKAFGDEAGIALEEAGIKQSMDRLVELGLLNKRKTKLGVGDDVYEKTIRLDSPEAIEVLRETGMKVGISGAASGNNVVFGLKGFDNQVDDIITYDNQIAQKIAKSTGLNPSAAVKTPMQKAVIAAARQTTSANELVEVTIQGQLDSLAQGKFGKLPVDIDADGFVMGTSLDGTTKKRIFFKSKDKEGFSLLWQDLFSIPADQINKQFKSLGVKLEDDAIEYIKRYQKIDDEMENLRVENGLQALSKDRNGWNYIPRQVTSIDEITLLKKSNPHNQRHWDSATDARFGKADEAGNIAEVKYDIDPRQTLSGHMRTAYNEIIDEQLKNYIAKNVETFTPTQILEKLSPEILARSQNATNSVLRARAAVKRASQKLAGAKTQIDESFVIDPKTGKVSKRQGPTKLSKEQKTLLNNIKGLQDELAEATEALGKAKGEFNSARLSRKLALEKAKKAELQPGKLFGEMADQKIPVKEWRGQIFKLEDYKELEKGIQKTIGNAPAFSKAIGRVADQARWLQATMDFGAPFIQGLPILARNPYRWTKATFQHYRAWLDPQTQAKYIEKNFETFAEMAQNGIPIGDVEFFAAMQQGRGIPVTKVLDMLPKEEGDVMLGKLFGEAGQKIDTALQPVGKGAAATRKGIQYGNKQFMGRFQNSYSMFLAYNRAELFKSLKPTWTKPGMVSKEGSIPELANYINNLTGGLDVKGLGVSSSLRELESTWLAFSPRLLRSTSSLMADAIVAIPNIARGKATRRQVQSLRSVGQTVLATQALAAAAVVAHGMAKGDSYEKIVEDVAISQNPLSGKRYLSIEIDGQHYGVGGQIRALTQLMTGLAAAVEDPTVFKDMDIQENPILRFMASRGAQGVRITQTLFEGVTPLDANPYEEIEGGIDLAQHLASDSLPFFLQGIMEGDSVGGMVAGMSGMRTSPSTASDDFNTVMEQEFRNQTEETLKEYGHTHGDIGSYPRQAKDMNSDLRAKLISESEELQQLQKDKQDERMERGSVTGAYIEEKNNEKKNRDDLITRAITDVGIGEKLRDTISIAYQDYVNNVAFIDTKSEYEDMREFFDEQEASENEYNLALEKYFEILQADPPIEDPIWGYDFRERERRLEAMREDPEMADHVDRIIEDVRNNALPVVQDLNKDRDQMKDYFGVLDKEIDRRGFLDRYEIYKKQDSDTRDAMQEGAVENSNVSWSRQDSRNLRRILERTKEIKQEMREDSLLLDALLWKWEYTGTPVNRKFKRILRRLKREYQGVTTGNRGEVTRYLQAEGLNW